MAKTDNYRKQHEELLGIVGELTATLNPGTLKTDAGPCSSVLAKLSGKVNMHLALEDGSLYPGLLTHADPKIKDTANKFKTEMGGIKTVFEGYLKKWSKSAIEGNADTFVKETKDLISVLGKRITAENTGLYEMVDKAA